MLQIDSIDKTIANEDQKADIITRRREFDSPENAEIDKTKHLHVRGISPTEEIGALTIDNLTPPSKFQAESDRNLIASPENNKLSPAISPNSPGKRRASINSSRMRSPNNLIFITLVNSSTSDFKTLINLIKFVVFKIMIPLFSFTLFCALLTYLQTPIQDYCFYPDLCSCSSLLIFVYTIIKEALHNQGSMLIILYYGTAFSTNDFYKSIYLRVSYLVFILLLQGGFFAAYYPYRKGNVFDELITWNGYLLFCGNLLFALLIGTYKKGLSLEFFKRIALVSFMQLCLFFHRFYFKSYAMFMMLKELENYYGNELGTSLFKLLLMLYYLFYEFLSKMFLLYFFREIIKEKKLSYNIVLVALKFISVDVLSISALNTLTMPLTEMISWICFFWYIYSIFSTYSRTNVLVNLPKKILRKIFKKKEGQLPEDELRFMDLRSGCIFETNLIVFLRILSYRLFPYFIFFTRQSSLYQDCSLAEKMGGHVLLLDLNLICLMVTHTVLLGLLGVVVYGFKLRKYLFNYHIEEINIFGRLLLFITCFSYADYTLQIYKAFDQLK